MYLGYDIKNGVKYAKICSSKRGKRKLIPHTIRMGREVDSLAWKQDANLYQ